MAPDRCASALGGAAPLAGGHRSSGAGNGSNAGAISARTMAVIAVLAVYYTVCLSIAGLNIALPVGIFTGLAVLIPYLGYFIGLTLALTAALLQFSDWYGFGAVAVIYGI